MPSYKAFNINLPKTYDGNFFQLFYLVYSELTFTRLSFILHEKPSIYSLYMMATFAQKGGAYLERYLTRIEQTKITDFLTKQTKTKEKLFYE